MSGYERVGVMGVAEVAVYLFAAVAAVVLAVVVVVADADAVGVAGIQDPVFPSVTWMEIDCHRDFHRT